MSSRNMCGCIPFSQLFFTSSTCAWRRLIFCQTGFASRAAVVSAVAWLALWNRLAPNTLGWTILYLFRSPLGYTTAHYFDLPTESKNMLLAALVVTYVLTLPFVFCVLFRINIPVPWEKNVLASCSHHLYNIMDSYIQYCTMSSPRCKFRKHVKAKAKAPRESRQGPYQRQISRTHAAALRSSDPQWRRSLIIYLDGDHNK